MMHTLNRIYGEAKNPFNPERTTGGSSGGDAGLVASRCMPFSIGTDIGGSIRGPSGFCSIYGFKPTPTRVSYKGSILPFGDGTCPQTRILPVCGPIAASVDDIALAFQALTNEESFKLDHDVAPIPFNSEVYASTLTKKLRVGYFDETVRFGTSSSVKRAIKITKDALEAKGH